MYTGIWRRIVAFVIDMVLVIGLFVITVYAFDALFNISQNNILFSFLASIGYRSFFTLLQEYKFVLLYYFGIFSALGISYTIFFLKSSISTTPGKLILGLEVSFHKKNIYYIFLRSLIKILLVASILGIGIEFLFMYIDKKGRTVHDFAAGSEIRLREVTSERVVPKGLWWFVLIALLSLTPYYFSSKKAEDSYTEVKYSEVISINQVGRELYEGVWANGKNWTLIFTYISDKLFIHDSNYLFQDFKFQEDNSLVCSDHNGNSYIFERKGNQLIATQTKDIFVRYYEFTKKEEPESK